MFRSGHLIKLFALCLILTLFLSNPTNAMLPHQDGSKQGSGALGPFISLNPWLLLVCLNAALSAKRYLLTRRPSTTSNDAEPEKNIVNEIVELLARAFELPKPALDEFQTRGNSEFPSAQIIIFNEDPFSSGDIEMAMRLISHNARPGDAIVFEGSASDRNSLERLFLIRMLCLKAIAQASPKYTNRQTQRKLRRQFMSYYTDLLVHSGETIAQNSIIDNGISLYGFDLQEDFVSSEQAIDARAKAQLEAIRLALSMNSRIFVIRNRAFSLHFFQKYLETDIETRSYYEAKYSCTLRSINDFLNCPNFSILNSMSTLHQFIEQYLHVELLMKRYS